MYIDNIESLREHYGEAKGLARDKVLTRFDAHCRHFIERSPYVVIATSDENGFTDASPRGDAPGFVQLADDKTLLIPDRKGNRRVDSLVNLMSNPRIGLLFMVPGVNETLRVNGLARLCITPERLAPFEVRGRVPEAVIEVTLDEAYLQCAKALIRSHLWDAERHVPKGEFPSLGKMLADQIGGIDVKDSEALIADSIKTRLY
jgi:PPOX class probable FMN-dependent enzyme